MSNYRYLNGYVLSIVCLVMMGLVSACSSHEDPIYLEIKDCYKKAHQLQVAGQYSSAISLYKKCIAEGTANSKGENDSVRQIVPKAMVQLVNAYQSFGKPKECVAIFDSLRYEAEHAPHAGSKILATYFKRDVFVLHAYALSRTEAVNQAAREMDEALKIKMMEPTHERLFRDYAYAAGVYYCVPHDQDKVLKYGQKALEEVKLCHQKSGAQWIVAILGKLYQGKGEIGKAIAMCREGYELAEQSDDTLGMANAKKELADYLYQWKLYEDANRYASDAISLMESTANSNPMVEVVAYTIKAKILSDLGKKEAAFACLDKAGRMSKDLPYNSGTSDVELLKGKLLVFDSSKNQKSSYQKGMDLLKNVSRGATYKLRAQAYFALAKASMSHGDIAYGEASLDSMYAVLNVSSSPIVIEGAYDYALAHYLKRNNIPKIVLYATAVSKVKANDEQVGSMKNVAQSLAQFEMEKLERQIEQREHDLEMRKAMEAVSLTSGLVLLLLLFTVFIYKRRKLHQQRLQAEVKLANVQMTLNKVSREKKKVQKQLKLIEENRIGKLKKGVALQEILDADGDRMFKEHFVQAYPNFLAKLKCQSSHMTSREELYCMLIASGVSNEQLAAIFHVARTSIVVAKYRLRKKLIIKKGDSMENFLQGLLHDTDEVEH